MKLNIVPASQGAQWVKLGIRTFFKQPLALTGLFFIFLAVMSVLNVLPIIGHALAFVLMPGATLGLLAASLVVAGPALASAELSKANGCATCHDATKKKMGPSVKEMASKAGERANPRLKREAGYAENGQHGYRDQRNLGI